MIGTILLVLAFVLFSVSAYISTDLGQKLERAGLAVASLAILLYGIKF